MNWHEIRTEDNGTWIVTEVRDCSEKEAIERARDIAEWHEKFTHTVSRFDPSTGGKTVIFTIPPKPEKERRKPWPSRTDPLSKFRV